jgi:hypothetical protein
MTQFLGYVKISNNNQADVNGWWEWFPNTITDGVPFEKSRVQPAPTN